MVKTKILVVRISPEQDQVLQAKARNMGILQKSDYVRFTLFMSMQIEEKIKKIYEKVCKNG